MKKASYIALALILSVFAGTAQPTITLADLPQPGYTYLVSTDTTPAINLGVPGAAAQNWNFSSLSEDYPSVPTYDYTSNTPYATTFTASNIYTYGPAALYSSFYGGAPVNANGLSKGYMFWKTDNSGFRIVGFRADSGNYSNHNVFENPQELLIGTPATYGSVFNNAGRWQLNMNLNPADIDTFYMSNVSKTLTSDAWGTLTTPSGTFTPVLRVHEYAIKTDSVYATLGGTPVYATELTRDTLNNYLYLDNATHYPVSIVHADKNNQVQKVEYYVGAYTGLSSVTGDDALKIHPNPLTTESVLSWPGSLTPGLYALRIYNSLGETVYSKDNSSMQPVQIGHLAQRLKAGLYLLEIESREPVPYRVKFIVADQL